MRLTPLDPWIARKIGHGDQPLTRADLEAYQLEQLRATLCFARDRCQFYHNSLAEISLDLTTLSDLAHIPFTTADQVRGYPLQFLCVSQDAIRRVVTLDTSGTSGPPKRLYFSRDDQELTIDFFHVGMSTFTDPGDRVLILLPCETPGSVGDLLAIALNRLGAGAIKHGPVRDPAGTMETIRREKIDVLVGVPTHVLALARQHTEPTPKLKSVLLTTDHVPNAIRQTVETGFGCTVYNHYGMTEMGLGGGVECAARRGYHLREADLFFEIVDPVSGQVLPDGEYGEVVFTTLTRLGMPLIRYRTGDRSLLLPGDCPCGTCLKTLERVTCRLDGLIRLGDGYLTLPNLDEALFAIDGVLDFRAVVLNEKGRDCLRLEVELTEEANYKAAINAILRAIPKFQHVEVSVLPVAAMPAAMTKRAILDRRVQP